jgi:hypothetical protein
MATTSMEQYQYARGLYDNFQATLQSRLACASTSAARQQIWNEGDQLRAQLQQLADQVRSERNGFYARNAFDIALDIDTLSDLVRQLDGDIQASQASEQFKVGWRWFVDEVQRAAACAPSWPADHYFSRLVDWLTMFSIEDGGRMLAPPRGAAPAAATPPTATVEQRYKDAIAYVRRAIDSVTAAQSSALNLLPDSLNPALVKTAPARGELSRLELRWSRATSDKDRAAVARDAELLADRVQEDLPGAPQDRQRTDLVKGEVPTSTPATSYLGELASTLGLPGNDRNSDGSSKTNWWKVAALGLGAVVGGVVIAGAARRRD